MEINGKQFSSEEFAGKIEQLTNDGVQEIVFVIGSSCGMAIMFPSVQTLK